MPPMILYRIDQSNSPCFPGSSCIYQKKKLIQNGAKKDK
jgi:hypothetical protein